MILKLTLLTTVFFKVENFRKVKTKIDKIFLVEIEFKTHMQLSYHPYQ